MLVAARIALAQHQRLRLGQHVGQQLRMVFGQRVRRLAHGDEFDRHHVGALVQHLEVGVLAIGAGLAPEHRRGAERSTRLAARIDLLAVAFHLQLLQIGRQALQRAVVRRDAAAGKLVEVAVPDVEQPQAHRQVLRIQRGGAKVLVHGVRARQQLGGKPSGPMAMRNRQADGRPERIAPAHPVPETEGGGRCQTSSPLPRWSSAPREVARDIGAARLLVNQRVADTGVGHRLGGGEGLGRDEEQRAAPAPGPSARRTVHARRRWTRSESACPARRTRPAPCTAICGPRSEPPMPMFTTSVMVCVAAHLLGVRQHGVERGVHLAQLAAPSSGRWARRPGRAAACAARRGPRCALMCSPANMASRCASRPHSRASVSKQLVRCARRAGSSTGRRRRRAPPG
jgi:hypothetical protein